MNVNKWKRLLSVMLTLCMALSWNVPTYAAEDARATQCPDGQHEFTKMIIDDDYVEPTCTADGFAKFECAKCGYFDFAQDDCFRLLPALGHKLEEVIDTPATCSAPGEKHVECTREGCGYREDSVEIPANGEHNFADAEEKVADATCTEPVKYGRPCQNEGCDEVADLRDSTDPLEAATGHDFENSTEYKVTTPATCTATGLEAKKCANPGCEEVDPEQTQVVAIDATNHGNHGTTEEATPSVPATCNSYAKYATTCDGCGAKVDEREDEAGGYDENNHVNLSTAQVQTKAPTCGEGGYDYQVCPDCHAEVIKEGTETDPDASKHDFPSAGDKVHVSDATCHTPAQKGYVCSICGAPNPESLENEDPNATLDPTKHEFGTETIVPATCTENAKLVKQCKYCDPKTDPTAYVVVKDLWTGVPEAERNPEHQAGHKWVDVPKVEPTCGAPGKEAGQQCSICEEWKDGEPDEIPADASKHVFGDTPETTTREASCAKAGLGKFKCTVCNKLAYQTLPAGHKYPAQGNVLVEATCLRPGTVEYTCERYNSDPTLNKCDLDDAGRVKTETVEQKEHDMQESTDPADGYKAATCVEDGVAVQKCATCGLIETTEIPATDEHNPQAETVIPSTECGVKPQIGTVCTVCHQFVSDGASDVRDMTDQEMTDAGITYYSDHNMVDDADNSVAATCTTPGVEAKKCSNPGCTHTEQTEIPAAHTFKMKDSAPTEVDYTAHQPNCLEAGYYTAYCTVCKQDITLTAEEETAAGLTALTAKTEHQNVVDMSAKDATCQKDGNTAGTKCETCGTIITGSVIPASSEHHVIDKTNQNSYEVVRAADCKTGKTGMSKQTCTLCGNVSYVPIQPEHTWDPDSRTTVTAADCVNGGQDSVTCSVCSAEDIIDTDPIGHNWDSGSDQIADGGKPASCGVAGIKIYTCQNADCPVGTKTEAIPALEHDWGTGNEITPATCGKAGEKEYTCSNCGEKKTEVIPKLTSHGMTVFGFIEANCQHGTQIGLSCQTCGQSVEKDGQPLVMDFTSATTVDEVKTFYSTNATDSGYGITVQDSDIESAFAGWTPAEATAHTWLETVKQEPTCVAAGTKDRVCAVCDTEEKNIAIPAKGHDLKEDTKNSVEPSCSNGGIGKIAYMCSRCDYTEEEEVDAGEIPHLEKAEVIKAATCTANGLTKYTCSECGNVRTEIVPAGHSWDEGTYTGSYQGVDAKEPTCTEGGKKLYTCEVCDAQELRDEDPLGHDWSTVKIIGKTCVDYAKVGKECATCGAASDDSVEITADSNVDTLINLLKTGMDDPSDTSEISSLRTQLEAIVADPAPEGHSYGTDDNPTGNPDADSTEATCTKEGLNKYTCSKCGNVLKVTVPMTDHELEKTYHDPTCAKGGYLEVSCNNCTTKFPDEMVEGDDPVPHDFETEEKPLTEGGTISDICTEGGTLVKTCKNEACGHHVETEAIAPGHSYALQQIKDVDNGNKLMAIIRVCTRDASHVDPTPVFVATGYGYCVTDGVNKLGEEDVVAGKPATCVEDGFTEKKICPVCKETIQESTVIPAKGHTEPTEWTHTKAATCAEEGLDEWKCTECGEVLKTQTVPKLTTHNYVEALEAATCSTPERYVKRCTVCKQLDPDYTIIEVNPADPSLHEFNDEGVCIHCGTALPEGWKKCATCNKWTEFVDDPTTATDATCTTPAQVTAKCKVCKTADPDGPHDVEGSVPDPYAHSFNAQDTCTICNKTAAELTNPENEAYLPLLAKCDTHGWVKGTEVPGTDSTCTVAGKEDALKCPKCATENIIKGGQDKPLADHTWTDKYELDADNMPTCLEDGTKHKVCDVCGNTFGDPVVAEASDEYHDYQTDEIPATCTTGAMVMEICSICGGINPEFPGEEIGAPDPYAHKFDAETEICEYCHKTGTELSAEAGQEQLGKCTTHGWQKGLSVAEVPSTCTVAGTAAGYRCPVCAEAGTTTMIRGGKALPLADHTPSGTYETIEEPTCQETGVKKEICDVCGNPFGEEITMDIVDHNYVEVSSAPTCTHGERHGFYCTMCDQLRPGSGVEEGTELDPTNHEGEGVIEVEAVEATCSVEGVTAGTKCKGCGEVLTGCEITGIDVDNHKHITDLPAVDPSCTEPGKTAGKKCEDCGEEIEPQTEIPALGHDFSEGDTCKECGTKNAETSTGGALNDSETSKRVTFTSNVTVSDKDAEIVEMGILYITSRTYDAANVKNDMTVTLDANGDFTTNHASVNAKRHKAVDMPNGTLEGYAGAIATISLGSKDSTANDNRMLYARGYVIIKKNGVYSIKYADGVTSGSYAGGFTTN